jgi:hypothetical protein
MTLEDKIKQIKFNLKLNKKLLKQIDLIADQESLNRLYSIEYLMEQLNNIYQEELVYQDVLNNN